MAKAPIPASQKGISYAVPQICPECRKTSFLLVSHGYCDEHKWHFQTIECKHCGFQWENHFQYDHTKVVALPTSFREFAVPYVLLQDNLVTFKHREIVRAVDDQSATRLGARRVLEHSARWLIKVMFAEAVPLEEYALCDYMKDSYKYDPEIMGWEDNG